MIQTKSCIRGYFNTVFTQVQYAHKFFYRRKFLARLSFATQATGKNYLQVKLFQSTVGWENFRGQQISQFLRLWSDRKIKITSF